MESGKKHDAIAFVAFGAVAVAGVIILLLRFQTPASFGWFAYAPLSDSVYIPGDVVMFPRWALIGAVFLIASLVAISYLLGRRNGRNR